MLGNPLAASSALAFSPPDTVTVAPSTILLRTNFCNHSIPGATRPTKLLSLSHKKWLLHSTLQIENLTEQDRQTWEACRQALSAFNFTVEEEDKILGKAFGHIQSPYWSEERKEDVPKYEAVSEILDYLRSLSLSDDDLCKVLKKFPEVLGCSFEHEVKNNVQILKKDWGIEGKSLRKLLLRNPKVLGYNVDCKGDCMAKCTRCWVRF